MVYLGWWMMDFLSGSEVIAKGAIEAGCRAFFGYPITPSSEIMALMAEELPKVGGVFMQMEDELAASAAAIGASWAGAKAMTATSGPGFSLMQENIGAATMLEIPLVVADVQRIGPSTGVPTVGSQQDLMQAIWGRHGGQGAVVLCPSSFQELLSMTVSAFNAAELLRAPVILLTDGHMVTLKSSLVIGSVPGVINRRMLDRKQADAPFKANSTLVPGFPPLGEGFKVLFDTLAHDERGYPISDSGNAEQLLRRFKGKLEKNIDRVWVHEESETEGPDAIVVSYGSSAISARYAVNLARARGGRVALLIMKCMWPLKEDELRRIFKGKKRVIVVEQALAQLSSLIRPFLERDTRLTEVSTIGRPPHPGKLLRVIRGEA